MQARSNDAGGSTGPSTAGAPPDERGQLILVMGLLLAVTFVALALFLNSVIYAENLATREGAVADDALTVHDQALQAAAANIEHANAEYAVTVDDVNSNLTSMMAGWTDLAARHAAGDGASVDASLPERANGTHIQQTDASRNFTAGGDPLLGSVEHNGNWTLASDVPAYRTFGMTVNQGDLYDGALSNADDLTQHGFRVEVTDGSETWKVYVVREGGVGVVVFDEKSGDTVGGSLSEYCAVDASQVTVNLTAETVGGSACEHLDAPAFNGALTISFHNADEYNSEVRSGGTYSLVVNDTSVDGTPYYDNGDSPFTTPAVYSARLAYTYERRGFALSREARVVPGNETAG